MATQLKIGPDTVGGNVTLSVSGQNADDVGNTINDRVEEFAQNNNFVRIPADKVNKQTLVWSILLSNTKSAAVNQDVTIGTETQSIPRVTYTSDTLGNWYRYTGLRLNSDNSVSFVAGDKMFSDDTNPLIQGATVMNLKS